MKAPATSWDELIANYAECRKLPVWGSMRRVPDELGRLSEEDAHAIRARGENAALRAEKALAKLRSAAGARWPKSPDSLTGNQRLFDKLKAEGRPGLATLKNLWEALIFERDAYRCRYCGRHAFEFFEASGRARSIWLVVDHLDASAKEPAVFHFANSVTACWSCNALKGPLPEKAFLRELDALVDGRLTMRQAHRPPRRT